MTSRTYSGDVIQFQTIHLNVM